VRLPRVDRGDALIDKQSFKAAIMRDTLSEDKRNFNVVSNFFFGRNEIKTVTSYHECNDILDTHISA